MQIANTQACIYPTALYLAAVLFAALLVHVFIITKAWHINYRPVLIIYFALTLTILWLGSYAYSPLGFSRGTIPLLRGFLITRFGRPPTSIASGEIVSIMHSSVVEIQPEVLPAGVSCNWSSNYGGAIDDPQSCDIAYTPQGSVEYDILRVSIRSSCHIPSMVGEIRSEVSVRVLFHQRGKSFSGVWEVLLERLRLH